MHKSKMTCVHGHPWYRDDCLECRFDGFHGQVSEPMRGTPTKAFFDPNTCTYTMMFSLRTEKIPQEIAR